MQLAMAPSDFSLRSLDSLAAPNAALPTILVVLSFTYACVFSDSSKLKSAVDYTKIDIPQELFASCLYIEKDELIDSSCWPNVKVVLRSLSRYWVFHVRKEEDAQKPCFAPFTNFG